MGNLEGKSAVVTGAGSGIGRAIALAFAREGASVTVADRDAASADRVAAEIRAAGGQSIASVADVTKPADLDAMVRLAEQTFGPLSVVACNAGIASYPVTFTEADADEFDRIYSVNVKGMWLTCRAVAESLRRAGGGSIVVTGSIMGERPRPGFGAYASSKAAVNHLSRILALELAEHRIRVNAMAPVATDTAMLPQFLGADAPEETRARFIDAIPLGRLATTDDVAETAVFLASDASAFITGAIVPIDGGRSV